MNLQLLTICISNFATHCTVQKDRLPALSNPNDTTGLHLWKINSREIMKESSNPRNLQRIYQSVV